MTQGQLERLELLERQVQKIAELLDAAFGNFTPACGGEFTGWSPLSPCHNCESLQQCKHDARLAEIDDELQGPIMRGVINWQNWR